jgi:hypothetical protein
MLRSQTPERPQREQIQAVLKYGTHGGYHGHFDRAALLSLMRYGRSFYNPEMVWYSYPNFMYAFYVQTSISKNMVTVDKKQQEPVESRRLLFYPGRAFQAGAVETHARWSEAPYGGLVYQRSLYDQERTFADKTWGEGRSVPIPASPPKYGSVGEYSEPILQRRLLIVTDDYIVLADYLKGDKEHMFDCLFQIKGFQGLDAPEQSFIGHDDQWKADPVSAAQFVTDCDRYAVHGPTKASFHTRFGPGADNAGTRIHGEDGDLKLDVYSLWPREKEITIGTVPENHGVARRLFYVVRGDGRTLAEGRFGAWILGRDRIDVPLEGLHTLELETRTPFMDPRRKWPKTLFWGDARIVTADGEEIPLDGLNPHLENIALSPEAGKDYYGGPIKIMGRRVAHAFPGQPEAPEHPGVIRIDLEGLDAVRFQADLGGDYPPGDEDERRKTYAVTTKGTEARFLTVVEPYEDQPIVRSAWADGPDRVYVELVDGRVQELGIGALDGDGDDVGVTLTERKEGMLLRNESTP